MENPNPKIKTSHMEKAKIVLNKEILLDVSPESVFELLRYIKDPEYPYTLEQLGIVSPEMIYVGILYSPSLRSQLNTSIKTVVVEFVPTIPHCTMASVIGLSILHQLRNYIKNHYVIVRIHENTHNSYKSINKQLQDPDRTSSAFENTDLLEIIQDSQIHYKSSFI